MSLSFVFNLFCKNIGSVENRRPYIKFLNPTLTFILSLRERKIVSSPSRGGPRWGWDFMGFASKSPI